MKEIFPSLYLIRPERPEPKTPFTYLLRRAAGNLLFATKADVGHLAPAFAGIGGLSRILLGDRHHALPHTEALARQMGAPLCCSAVEAAVLKKSGVHVDQPLPLQRIRLAPDLEIIPTPGHTKGAFSYLWTHAGRRFLFIGDTLVPVDGTWRYWVSSPNRGQMRDTVRMLAGISFDVILSNSFAATPVAWVPVDARSQAEMFAELERGLG